MLVYKAYAVFVYTADETIKQKEAGAMLQADRAELSVGADSWHYRLYNWYQERHYFWVRRESLCHYMRVVLIWAPTYFFLSEKVMFDQTLAQVSFALAVVTMIIFGLVIWPSYTVAILIGVAIVLFLGLFRHELGIVWVAEFAEDARRGFFRRFDEALDATLKWYASDGDWRWAIGKFIGTCVLLELGIYKVFGPEAALKVLVWAVGAVLTIAFLIGWSLGIDAVRDRRRRRRIEQAAQARIRGEAVEYQKLPGTSTVRLAWAYLVALKHKICPYINLPESSQSSDSENRADN
jgi:hypothetical protein